MFFAVQHNRLKCLHTQWVYAYISLLVFYYIMSNCRRLVVRLNKILSFFSLITLLVLPLASCSDVSKSQWTNVDYKGDPVEKKGNFDTYY